MLKYRKSSFIVGLLVAVLLIVSMGGVACAPKEEESYVWSTPPAGGMGYILTGALAWVTESETGIKAYVETVVSLDVIMMRMHQEKGVDFAESGFPRVVMGYAGTYPAYQDKEPITNIRMMVFGPGSKPIWVSMKQHANITTWEEMKGKTIMAGTTEIYLKLADATLKYHNVRDEVKELRMGASTSDLVRNIIEGRVDVALGWSGTSMYDFDAAGGYNIIEQPPEEVKAIVKEYNVPGFVPGILEEGEFGAARDFQVAMQPLVLCAGIHVPKDVVYRTLKAIMMNEEKLAKIHAKAGEYANEYTLAGLGCPIHPGAKQYYQEVGMWTDELEAENQQLLDMYGFKE